jgi:uncharacterized membrane protein
MSLEHGVQDELNWQSSGPLGQNPRWLALALGGGLLIGASSRRSVPLALVGAALLYRGATGRWAFGKWLGLEGSPERRHPATSVPHESGIKIERSITIQKSPDEIYRFWRALENLPRFMSQHVSVERRDDTRSHWKVASIGGAVFEWDAEIVNDIPSELLAWRSLDGADLDHAGSVHFESDGRDGTRLKVVVEYRPPAGKWTAGVAWLFSQEPGQVLQRDLRRLKQLLETGEISSVEGQPHGAT